MQEEPKNMGAWLYVKPRLDTAMRELFGKEVRLPHSLGTPAAFALSWHARAWQELEATIRALLTRLQGRAECCTHSLRSLTV